MAPASARSGGVEITAYRAGDEASICRLFERTFGRAKSLDMWRWQFRASGAAPLVMVARDAAGEVIGHFGAMPRRFVVDGREFLFAVAVDSMVACERRCGLRRRGLFVDVVERWVDCFGRSGVVAVAYGLPNREALRIGSRMLGYAPIEPAVLLVRDVPAARGAPPPARTDLGVTVGRAPEVDHDALWRRVRARHRAAALRDRDYLTCRYQDSPASAYRFIAVREARDLVAAAVFAPHYAEPGCASLLDVVWDGADERAFAACVAQAEALTAGAGLTSIAALFAPHACETACLAARGYRAIPTGMPLVARSFDVALPLAALGRGRLEYSLGDFDLA